MSRPLQCPTRVFSNRAYVDAVGDLVGGRRWTLVTSAGWSRRGCVDDLTRRVGDPVAVIDAVPSNPKVSDLGSLSNDMAPCDIVIALGGGSVIDAAKGLVGLQALDGDMSILMAHLRDGTDLPDTLAPVPLIAVPTTSGTGSEVTRWATVWGDDRVKFSLQHSTLYPSDAILDPALCTSMPEDLTLATGLDALSHAMEAVWNRNSTPLSDRMATTAIEMLFAFLAPTLASPSDVELRRHIQIASLIAGLAMGTTQTALAHSISYPFTAHFGMPHGFACSFTLPEVVRYNIVENSSRLAPVAAGLGCDLEAIADTLDAWFDALGVARHVIGYVAPEVTDQFGDDLITRARAANNIRDIDGPAARAIARRSLDRLSGDPSARD